MPMYQFQCLNPECAHTFELLLYPNGGEKSKFKWCRHCDHLTLWAKVESRNSALYEAYPEGGDNLKEEICCMCHGNSVIAPRFIFNTWPEQVNMISSCTKCGKAAEHVLAVDYHGKDDVAHSSVRFHFNYLEPGL